MNSRTKEAFNNWIDLNYDRLLSAARKFHPNARDLVSHVYLRVEKADMNKVMENPFSYFTKAMHIEGTRGTFKELYRSSLPITTEPIAEPHTLVKSIRREQLEIFCDRLNWFDKTIFKLWLRGDNISQLARESGIPHETLHTSLHRTKKKIKNAFSKLQNKRK